MSRWVPVEELQRKHKGGTLCCAPYEIPDRDSRLHKRPIAVAYKRLTTLDSLCSSTAHLLFCIVRV